MIKIRMEERYLQTVLRCDIFLFTELTKHSDSSYNPVFWRLHCGQPHGYDKVCGVAGSGQYPATIRSFIKWTDVRLSFFNILLLHRHQP